MKVLFLHAFPLSSEMFEENANFLREEGIPYILLNYPGFGGEEEFPSEEVKLEDFTDYVVERLSQEGVKEVVAVGVSMGGYIMMDLWERYRELIKGFVFVATRCQSDSREAKERRKLTIKNLLEGKKDKVIEGMLELQTSPSTKKNPEKMEKLRGMMEKATTRAMVYTLKALMNRKDYCKTLESVDVPTLVIAGEDDKSITPPEVVEEIAKRVKNSEFYVLKGSAHLPNFENPKDFNQKLLKFLKAYSL